MLAMDPSDLQTVVSNLVDNALKYTPRCGHVRISLANTKTGAVLSVSDTGAGFGSKERPQLFDRFYRANDDSVGSGLGLSIVHAIVTGYRGTVEAESEGPGTGSRFTVSLPRANGSHETNGLGLDESAALRPCPEP